MGILDTIKNLFKGYNASGLTETEFLELELRAWLQSSKRYSMLMAAAYYQGEHNILSKQRTAIGIGGNAQTINNLPNNRIIDNQYAKLVDQKVNYLLTKPLEIKTKSDMVELQKIFNQSFRRRLKNVGEDSLNAGIGYLYPYVDNGVLKFKRFAPEQILPFWSDEEHEELDAFLRVYVEQVYIGRTLTDIVKAEYYTTDGVKFFVFDNDRLTPDHAREDVAYLSYNDKQLNWERVPLIAFKYNNNEISLLSRVKCLQDALNTLLSNFADNMQEDIRSTILVIKNYDGEDLGEFRRNLATYGAVKVRSADGADGGIETLSIDVNASNYELIIKLLKKAIVENGRGYDAKDDRMTGNPNQMNIQSMYSDIDLDANNMELEYQASFEQLMWFVQKVTGLNNMAVADAEFVFNRDILINEGEAIENCAKSAGVISKATIVSNHPWTLDSEKELAAIETEYQADIGTDYAGKKGETQ